MFSFLMNLTNIYEVNNMAIKEGYKMKVEYTGTLNDGSVFDSSEGKEPLSFKVGAGQVIKGFDESVIGMEKEREVEPIKTSELLMLSVNTEITVGNVIKIKDDEVELDLRIPVVPFANESVGIARNIDGHWRLMGWGEITN